MIRRPPRSTLDRSSAASDVYKRQDDLLRTVVPATGRQIVVDLGYGRLFGHARNAILGAVSYTHLRAHETVLDLVCRLLLEKKKKKKRKKKRKKKKRSDSKIYSIGDSVAE